MCRPGVWFLSHFGLETGVDFNHYALKSDLLLLTTSTHSGENEKKKGTRTKSVVKYYCMLLKYESCLIRSRCLMWERAHCVTVVSFGEGESALGDNNKTKAAKETYDSCSL